jgi:hypothetical protein
MSTRRSRRSRARNSSPSEAPRQDIALAQLAPDPVAPLVRQSTDPSTTAQLRAIEAGWDELLG